MVRENHDFRGSDAGGVASACDLRVSCRVRKSEYLFWTANDRRGSLRVMLYSVYGLAVMEVCVSGIAISTEGAMVFVPEDMAGR